MEFHPDVWIRLQLILLDEFAKGCLGGTPLTLWSAVVEAHQLKLELLGAGRHVKIDKKTPAYLKLVRQTAPLGIHLDTGITKNAGITGNPAYSLLMMTIPDDVALLGLGQKLSDKNALVSLLKENRALLAQDAFDKGALRGALEPSFPDVAVNKIGITAHDVCAEVQFTYPTVTAHVKNAMRRLLGKSTKAYEKAGCKSVYTIMISLENFDAIRKQAAKAAKSEAQQPNLADPRRGGLQARHRVPGLGS